jgi:hypothetical protein
MIWLGILIGVVATLVLEAIAALVLFVLFVRQSKAGLAEFDARTASTPPRQPRRSPIHVKGSQPSGPATPGPTPTARSGISD